MSVYSTAQLCIHCKQTVKLCLNPLKSIWSSINFHAQYSQFFLATTCPISLYVSTWVTTWGLPSLDGPDVSISMAIGQTNHKYPRNLTYTCQFWLKVVIKKNKRKHLKLQKNCGNRFSKKLENTTKILHWKWSIQQVTMTSAKLPHVQVTSLPRQHRQLTKI